MSLNWKEIDLILQELKLVNTHIQKIRQPDFNSLVFDLYRPKEKFILFIGLKQGETRIHSLSGTVRKNQVLQRFAQFLRSRITGGRIIEASQLDQERIVKISVLRGGENTILWVRLWGGAANIIATNSEGEILDAFYRRPKKREVSGGFFYPQAADFSRSEKTKIFEIRDLSGEESFNKKVELFYSESRGKEGIAFLREKAVELLKKREQYFQITEDKLEKTLSEYKDFDSFRQYGDILISNIGKVKSGELWFTSKNLFKEDTTISIQIDPLLTPIENAKKYYHKYKKAKSGMEYVQKEIAILKSEQRLLQDKFKLIQATADQAELNRIIKSFSEDREPTKIKNNEKKRPGLLFKSGPYLILIGRTAKENDELLRKHVRGNDLWLHTRDFPGGYVFIKHIQGKTIPLDTLLDAGNLALYYSKAGRASGKGELYFTKVKYLRRVKEGEKGLVLPTNEKNLSVVLDLDRIKKIKSAPDHVVSLR